MYIRHWYSARSPIRPAKSHQGSINRPCSAACIQRPISTQATTNNSHQKYQPAVVSTLTAPACCKDSNRTRRRGTNAAVQPLLRDTTSPTSETEKAGAYLQGTANSHQGYSLECIEWR